MLQVKETLLQKCREVEETAKDQATDNAILDQLRKVCYNIHKCFPFRYFFIRVSASK